MSAKSFLLLLLIGLAAILSACGLLSDTTDEEVSTASPRESVEAVSISPTIPATSAELATETAVSTNTTAPTSVPETTAPTSSTETASPHEDVGASIDPTATILPAETPISTVETVIPAPITGDLSISADNIFLYPVPEIYAGEQVTFQILAHVPDALSADDVPVQVWVDNQKIADGTLRWRNLAGKAVGLFEWVWDTTNQIGSHTITVTLDPNDSIQAGDENIENNQAILTAVIQAPTTTIETTWVTAETTCCTVHVVSGTAAYRDLATLLTKVETAVQEAATQLGEQPNQKYDVYLIDRVIGQGGYAGSSMVISYLDRHYANGGLHEVLVHETVHLLDRQFAPQRISFFAEGLAVYATGGHYKQENLTQRAAALVEIGQYIPLAQLIDNFYPVQHEIGYLEAAGFLTYLIDTYGWPQVRAFYSDVTQDDATTLSGAVDLNMQTYFGTTLAAAEADWLAQLTALPADRTAVSDLQTTLRFYNIMRQYQQYYDPTAHFLTAWLPYPQSVESEGNPADLTRHPETEINIALEVMLQATDTALREQEYRFANVLLDSISRVLENNGLFVDPLATQYLGVVQTAAANGYEAHQAYISGNSATVLATRGETAVLTTLQLSLQGRDWVLSE